MWRIVFNHCNQSRHNPSHNCSCRYSQSPTGETMEVEDLSGTHGAHSIAELEQLLGVRFNDRLNHFWLRADGSKFPELAIMVNGDLSAIHYFPQKRHAGFVSLGGKLNLDPDKTTTFSISHSPADDAQVRHEFVIPFSEAMKVAKEFSILKSCPARSSGSSSRSGT